MFGIDERVKSDLGSRLLCLCTLCIPEDDDVDDNGDRGINDVDVINRRHC